MIQTFTADDVLRHLYHELTQNESQCMEDALSTDCELAAAQQEFEQVKELLDEMLIEPSDAVIDRILAFSRNYPPGQASK